MAYEVGQDPTFWDWAVKAGLGSSQMGIGDSWGNISYSPTELGKQFFTTRDADVFGGGGGTFFDEERYGQHLASQKGPTYQARQASPYSGLYGVLPQAPKRVNIPGPGDGAGINFSPAQTNQWLPPFKLGEDFISYMDKTHPDWDKGLADRLGQVAVNPRTGAAGANYQGQSQALAEYLSQFDDPQVQRYASGISDPGFQQSLADYATSRSKIKKANQWSQTLQALSVLGGPVMSAAGGALSSFLSPALGQTAAPIASSALMTAGRGLLSDAIIGGALNDMPTPRSASQGSSLSQDTLSQGAQVSPSLETTAQATPLSQSVMNVNSSRPPLIRLTPGFRRGY